MEQELSELKQQLAEAEHNTVLAATYGKQLLDKNKELEAKLEILDLESIVGSQRLEITQKIEEKELLEAQLKEARERLDNFNSLNQSVDDSTGILQAEVTALTQEKQELETLMSSLKVQLSTYKYRQEQADKKLLDLESALEEKECQFTSYYNALEVRQKFLRIQGVGRSL
ncbi:hypothetical protein E2C01_064117 [Portunus trituberculatus]|uniref:Uncharacterized protein n=1 Tax=Portunus trituberculatus TaxID=210409 RepID=A0A5B7HMV5_PORTR|nr:hypothetical protein [Portunus trituberculatus]